MGLPNATAMAATEASGAHRSRSQVRRDGRQLLRVYCYLDEERRLVVVGHVGGHLPDGTT